MWRKSGGEKLLTIAAFLIWSLQHWSHRQRWSFKPGSCSVNYKLPTKLTFTHGTDPSPGAIVAANTSRGTNKMVTLGASEMDLMPNKILWSELGSVSRGFQGRAGGGSCGRETESKASHMWNKPPDILWHSLPGDIHVSQGSRKPSWERTLQTPHLQSASRGLAIFYETEWYMEWKV